MVRSVDHGWTPDEIDDVLADSTPVRPRARQRVADVADVADAEEEPKPQLGEVLDELTAHLRRFVSFQRPEQADAVALWTAHTHAIDAVEQSPILAIPSPVKRSGKSRLLETIEPIVHDAWRVERPSEAVLFRRIDRDRPTVMLDEADAIFGERGGQYEGIRALFNAGNRPGTRVPRAVAKGRGFELVDFAIFCPKAVAGIGRFPETLTDRSIVISMARKKAGESIERLRARNAQALGRPIRRRLTAALRDCPPLLLGDEALPVELDDRSQDNWESLLALAELAGGSWPARARKAALALEADRTSVDDNVGLTLLADIRMIFDAEAVPFIATTTLIDRLVDIERSPWSEWRGGNPLSARGLAKLLTPFGISPEKVRDGQETLRGYARHSFEDAWARYVPVSETSATSATSATAGAADDAPAPETLDAEADEDDFTDGPASGDDPQLQEWLRAPPPTPSDVAWEH